MDVDDITKIIDINKVEEHILNTSIVGWNNYLTKNSIDNWLDNFSGKVLGDTQAERSLAAWLLMNFTFYTEKEVNQLCNVIYRLFIHNKLEKPNYLKLEMGLSEKIRRILKHTVFLALGNPSESGSLVLYQFRTANSLSKDVFDIKELNKRLEDHDIDDIVLLDDVTISGTQAVQYIKDKHYVDTKTTLLTFFATHEAISKIRKEAPSCSILYAQLLDERTKVFHETSFYFSNDDTKKLKYYAHKLCEQYGMYLVENELPPSESYMKEYPLGYGDGQQMFAFYYNTPNNTLPIFWCDSPNWHAAFKRLTKVYSVEGVVIENEQYW